MGQCGLRDQRVTVGLSPWVLSRERVTVTTETSAPRRDGALSLSSLLPSATFSEGAALLSQK